MAEEAADKKLCAYCGSQGPFTREHVWPRGISKRAPSYDARYFGKADKVLPAEQVVKDVCSTCNNGVLSELDEYACGLYDQYFHQTDIRGQRIQFRYEFARLLRWLLKVSYNASRPVGIDTETLERCVPYILGTEKEIKDVWLLVLLIEPFSGIIKGEHKDVPAMGIRAARLEFGEDVNPPFIMRIVAVNAFCFIPIITKEGRAADFALAKRQLRGKQVPRAARSVVLKPSGLNVRDFWLQHFLDKEPLYEKHFARQRAVLATAEAVGAKSQMQVAEPRENKRRRRQRDRRGKKR